MFENSV